MKTVRVIWRLIRQRPWHFATSATSAGVLAYWVQLLPGPILKSFFDALTKGSGDSGQALMLAALLVGAAAAQFAVMFIAGLLEPSLMRRNSIALQRSVLATVLSRPGAQAVPHSTGEAVSRFRDDTERIAVALAWGFDPIGVLGGLAVALVVLWSQDPRLTAFVIVPMMAGLVIVNLAGRWINRYRLAAQQAAADVAGFISECFAAFVAIRTAGAESRATERFRTLGELRRRTAMRDATLAAALEASGGAIVAMSTGVLLLLAAGGIENGGFTVGKLVLFVAYMGPLTVATKYVSLYATIYRQAGVSLGRLFELVQEDSVEAVSAPGSLRPSDGPPQPLPHSEPLDILEVRGLTFVYPGSTNGIRDVSFRLEHGSFVVVTGGVGSGKTTLLRALLGLLPTSSGEIYWNTELVSRPDLFMVPPRCAYTPQVPRIFGLSLAENIALGVAMDRDHLRRAVESAQLAPDVAVLTRGVDTVVGARGTRLSGGQVHRVAVARMLIREPRLLVVDDVSSALDLGTEQQLWDSLEMTGDATVVAVSHRHRPLERADRILLMDGGRLVDTGTLAELLQRSATMREIWREPDAPGPASDLLASKRALENYADHDEVSRPVDDIARP